MELTKMMQRKKLEAGNFSLRNTEYQSFCNPILQDCYMILLVPGRPSTHTRLFYLLHRMTPLQNQLIPQVEEIKRTGTYMGSKTQSLLTGPTFIPQKF
jgi:hypothetical protein